MTEPERVPSLPALRRLLLALFTVSVAGTAIELLLLGHTEERWQLVPPILLAACLVVALWQAVRPGRTAVRTLRAVGVLCVASGAVGLFLHYRGNAEFELEMYPSRAGWELFREAMTGATPALAPGTMVMLGFLGLLYTFRHPLLASPPRPTPDHVGETR